MSWNLPHESRYGIHSVDHFALEVPSLDDAEKFFSTFGLRVTRQTASQHLELRASASEHVWGRIFPGTSKRLAYLSLSCYPNEHEGLVAQLKKRDVQLVNTGEYVNEVGTWFRDNDGNLLQIKPGPKLTPNAPSPQVSTARRAGERAVLGRSETGPVYPRRLSHLLMFSSDLDRSIAFYRDVLGLRLSDRSADAVAFMHARHGSDHHLIAFAKSHAKGWHHSSWEMANLDEVGRGGERMRLAGYAKGWGTGRHVLGSNYFHYVRDPWGSFAEYSADIDYVPAGSIWPAGDFPPEDSLYLWGPELPPYFIENTEV